MVRKSRKTKDAARAAKRVRLEGTAGRKEWMDSRESQGEEEGVTFGISVEQRPLWWSSLLTEDKDGNNDQMEVDCKVEIDKEDECEEILAVDPLYLNYIEELPTAITTSGSVTKVSRTEPDEGGADGGDHELVKFCLLCFKEISSAATPSSCNVSGMDADFLTIFILKKMLEVPNENLQDYLKCLGNPRNWIRFCDQCEVKIMEGLALQQEIEKLERKLRKFLREIKDTIAQNFVENQKKVEGFTGGAKSDTLRVTRETWCRVGKGFRSKPRRACSKIKVEVSTSSSPVLHEALTKRHSISPLESTGESPVDKNPTSEENLGSTPKTDQTSKRKRNRGTRSSSRRKKLTPTYVEDDEDFHYSDHDTTDYGPDFDDPIEDDVKLPSAKISKTKTTLTANKPRFDNKWALKPRFKKKEVLPYRSYSCVICPGLKAMDLESFTKHIIYHKERRYRCSVCDVFLTGSELELNKLPKLVHKKEGVPEDHRCSKETLVPVKFQLGNYLECGFCKEETFSSEEERRTHEREIHNKTSVPLPYDCSKCSKTFRDYVEWRLHRALEHPQLARLGCFYCDEIFAIKTKQDYDLLDTRARMNHIHKRHGSKIKIPYLAECEFCGEIFRKGGNLLQDHLEAEHGVARKISYSCPICFLRFKCQDNLTMHTRHHADVCKKSFICDMCGYEHQSSHRFLEHKFMKHGIEPEDGRPILSCKEDNCSFKCTIEKTLKVHMMKEHNAARKHKCETCGKGFLNLQGLKEHRLIHLGIKPYQCEICGNSFAVPKYLYIHTRLTHQNRPFASTNKKKTAKKDK